MNIDGIGSSVVIALAAVLWFVYLVPTWLRRREYLATERNAVRLQQTLRIMAETAQVPDEVRTEATAREVARQERALREQHARTAEARTARAGRRLRRSRLVVSAVLLASIVAAGFGVLSLVVAGDAVVLVASVVVAFGSLLALGQLSAVARERARSMRAADAPVRSRVSEPVVAEESAEDRSWTPVPVPKPLYLSRPAPTVVLDAAPSVASAAESSHAATADAEAELREAAAESERALREAQQAVPRVVAAASAAEKPVAAPGAPSRFARMGIVEAVESQPADLDAILKRRRAV